MGEKYSDKGRLGSFRTSDAQFPDPPGVKHFTGFGADESDLVKGYVEPVIRALPDYDKINYAERWTEPKMPDEDDADGSDSAMRKDYEFRMRERQSKGFFTRPRIPTER